MSKLNLIILIISIFLFLIALIVIVFKMYHDKLKSLIKKIDDTESSCQNKIKDKYQIIIRAINLVENKLKIESKVFEDTKKCKLDSINAFKNEKLLTKCFDEILIIKDDNPKSKSLRTFKEIISDYDENELHIVSLRTYYNKYAMIYNNSLRKFPYNIVSKLKRYKMKLLFEGKEIEKED